MNFVLPPVLQAYALKVIQEKYEEGVRKQIVQEMQILRRSQCEHVSGLDLASLTYCNHVAHASTCRTVTKSSL